MCSVLLQSIFRFCGGKSKQTGFISSTGISQYSTQQTQLDNMITEEDVSQFLLQNVNFLEDFIMENIEVEQLERWIIRKSKKGNKIPDTTYPERKTSLSKWRFCVHADKRQMLKNLTHSLQVKPNQDHVLWELANCISAAIKADGFRLYLVDKVNPEQIHLYLGIDRKDLTSKLKLKKSDVTIPTYVARTQQSIRFSKGRNDCRFPADVMKELQSNVGHIHCQPIKQSDGKMLAVLEMWRHETSNPFYEEDEEIACSYLVWGGIALHYAQLYINMNQQRELNDFLLIVVKSIFQNMVSIDSLVIKIMNFAQRLVDADRASLFLVDSKSKELYATVFDVGVGEETLAEIRSLASEEEVSIQPSKEIRFPLGTGIAGQVAMNGHVLNIKDAYADPRFNRAVDQLTGYTTHTILCMPIFIRGSIIGVVQMVNKHKGYFTKNDEEAFETFAVYCGLALHHAKLYDKIRKSQQKYKVALDVLSYHNTCTDEEYKAALQVGMPKSLMGIDNYYFNSFDLKDIEKTQQAMFMFNDLFGECLFDQSCLLKFILTVRKNYRRVPYHNWTHGFSVANSIYCILKCSPEVFKRNEALALYVGALCHDLDHRGKNNKFMLDTESPLAAIYSTSTMEHHHFNQTVMILQQEGHNIFSKLLNEDYKQVLSYLKHCILATDLALFFTNKTKLGSLVRTGSFSWDNGEHRRLIQAIAMTSSDLSASAKPWEIQVKTVQVIVEEFYEQGDAERKAGRTPIPMMDRHQPDEQPASQVGFLMGICLPCYRLLTNLIPETKPMLEMCEKNLEKWKKIDANIKHSKKDLQSQVLEGDE